MLVIINRKRNGKLHRSRDQSALKADPVPRQGEFIKHRECPSSNVPSQQQQGHRRIVSPLLFRANKKREALKNYLTEGNLDPPKFYVHKIEPLSSKYCKS